MVRGSADLGKAITVLWRLDAQRGLYWAPYLVRSPVILAGAAVSGWALTSFLVRMVPGGPHAVAVWLPALGGLMLALAASIAAMHHGYRARLLAGPFHPILLEPRVLPLWVTLRSAALCLPAALCAVTAAALRGPGSQGFIATMAAMACAAAVAGAGACAGAALGAKLEAGPRNASAAPPPLAVRHPQQRARWPVAIILRARLRGRASGGGRGAGAAAILLAGVVLAFFGSRNAPQTAAGALLFALTGAVLVVLLFTPDLRLVGLLRATPAPLHRLLLWFLAPPLAVGAAWSMAVSFVPGTVRSASASVATAAALLAWAWLAVLLLHGFTKQPSHARFAAQAEVIFLALLCGLFVPAVPVLVPAWCVLRIAWLVPAARRGRWVA